MPKTPLFASDFTDGKFSSLSKFISKNWPDGKLKLSNAQELLSRFLGYDDFHDAQKSASNPDSDQTSKTEAKAAILERLKKERLLADSICEDFFKSWPLAYLGFFNESARKFELSETVGNTISAEFLKCWHYELDRKRRIHSSNCQSFRDLATTILMPLSDKQQEMINEPLLDLFLVGNGNALENLDTRFQEIHARKTAKAIEGAFERGVYDEITEFLRKSGVSRNEMREACLDGELFQQINQWNFNASLEARLLKPAINVFLAPAADRLITLGDMNWPVAENQDSYRKELEDSINRINGDLAAFTLEAFKKSASDFEDLEDASPDELADIYKSQLEYMQAEANDSLSELRYELKESSKIGQCTATTKIMDVEVQFQMTQVDTEGVDILDAYNWYCQGISDTGEVKVLICGSTYNTDEDPFLSGRDLIFTADFQTDLDVNLAKQLLVSLCKEESGKDDASVREINSYEMSEIFEYGPLVVLQHMQRTNQKELKGLGFEALSFAIKTMSEYFSTQPVYLAVDLRPSQFYYRNQEPKAILEMKKTAVKKLESAFYDFCNDDNSPIFGFSLLEPKELLRNNDLLMMVGTHLVN